MSHLLLSSLIKTQTKKKNPKQNGHKACSVFPCYPSSPVEDNSPSAASGSGSEYCGDSGALSAAVTCRVASLCFKSSPSQTHGTNPQWCTFPLWAVKTFIWLRLVKSTGATGVWLGWPALPGLAATLTHPNDLLAQKAQQEQTDSFLLQPQFSQFSFFFIITFQSLISSSDQWSS